MCQHIKNDSLVLGVNSDLKRSEGYLTRATEKDFARKIKKLIKGKAKIRKLSRLEVKINGKKLPILALNETSFSKTKPYLTFTYKLKGNIEKASGILVATPIGTTAWAKSTGGKVLKPGSKKMEFIIREPYVGKIYKIKKKYAAVDSFTFKTISKGIIVFDSVSKEYHFNRGDTISVSLSKHPINLIEF